MQYQRGYRNGFDNRRGGYNNRSYQNNQQGSNNARNTYKNRSDYEDRGRGHLNNYHKGGYDRQNNTYNQRSYNYNPNQYDRSRSRDFTTGSYSQYSFHNKKKFSNIGSFKNKSPVVLNKKLKNPNYYSFETNQRFGVNYGKSLFLNSNKAIDFNSISGGNMKQNNMTDRKSVV